LNSICHTLIRSSIVISASVSLVACGPGDIVEIEEVSEVPSDRPQAQAGLTEAQRLGYDAIQPAASPSAAPAQNPFIWESPEGWTELKGSQFRIINFKVGESTECYVSALPGGGGGIVPNLNRWREQMGLPPFTQDELEALEFRPLINTEAYSVKFDGSFQGMGASEAQPGYRMLGLIQDVGGLMIFQKMVGPVTEVEPNEAAFYNFAESIRFRRQSGE